MDRPGTRDETIRGRLLLAALLAALLALKLLAATRDLAYDPDPSYYHDIAAHVRDGDGLVTDVSLFNAGYPRFPHPTAVYPLWPLLLGLAGRVVPLDLAAVWLPALLHLATVVLAYRLARRAAPGPLFPGTCPDVHAGHLAALLVGLTDTLFFATAKPYTEGLGYFLLLLALTRAHALLHRPAAWRGLEVGVWLGLVILTRSQLALAAVAVGLTLAWAVRLDRRWLAPAAAYALGLAAVLAVQYAHLATFVDGLRPSHLLRFDLARPATALPQLGVMVETGGPLAWLTDRAQGIPVAFGVGHRSYFHSFGLWSLALTLPLPFLLADLRAAAAGRARRLVRWLHDPSNLFTLAFALLAAAGVASLHTIHKALFAPWNFGTRHGLTAGFAVFAGLLYLARRPGLARRLALALVLASSGYGLWRIADELVAPSGDAATWTAAHNQPIADWLTARAAEAPGLVVVAPDIEAQKLARFTDGVGYHWSYRTTTWAELDHFFDALGATYLLLRDDRTADLAIGRDPDRFAATYTRVAADLSGFSVYRRRRPGDPPAAWPSPDPGKGEPS